MKVLFVANNLEHFFKDLFEGLALNNEIKFFRFSRVPNLLKFVIAAKKSDIIFVEYLAGAAWTVSRLKSLVRKPIVVRCHRFELYERLRNPLKNKLLQKNNRKCG